LACRLKPSRFSSRPTSFWPALRPKSASAADRWLALAYHTKAASGSPRIADCTKSLKASKSPGGRWLAATPLSANARAEHSGYFMKQIRRRHTSELALDVTTTHRRRFAVLRLLAKTKPSGGSA
jgi:hypothetical protein